MDTVTFTDGKVYQVAHHFSKDRAIIHWEGLFVLVDRVDEEHYELSGEPARPHEKPMLDAFVATIESGVTVTAP